MDLDETRLDFAGIFLMKKLDLEPKDGGIELPIALPRELEPLDPVLERLVLDGWVAMEKKKGRYRLTEAGIARIGSLIEEAEHYVQEFDDEVADVVVAELRRRRLDPLRVRFLWGWYQGEFDDLVLWQQRRGLADVETSWADYLVDPRFWDELATELG
jgi:hypothetical protein